MALVWAKIVNGATVILGGNHNAEYAEANGFSRMEVAEGQAEALPDVNAAEIDGMTVKQRTGVLKKIVQHLKGSAAVAIAVVPFCLFGAAGTAELGDLTDTSTVVTNVAAVEAVAAAAKDKADSHDAAIVSLTETVGTWSRYWGGDDFLVVVTNYPVTVGAKLSPSGKRPTLSMSWKTTNADGQEYMQEVWNESWRFDWLTGEYLPTNFYNKAQMDAKLADKADRAWGFYDSHTGLYSPMGYTQVSSPHILIAGGMSYQQTLTASGSVWVLTSNGMVTQTGGDAEHGYFRVADAEGNVSFEIVKGNKRTVGAMAGGISVSGNTTTIVYDVEAAEHPTLYVSRQLGVTFKREDETDCPSTVSWSGQSGHWVATATAKVAERVLFYTAEYEMGAETIIRNNRPVEMQYIYLDGQKYKLGKATISGNTVMTLTLAN